MIHKKSFRLLKRVHISPIIKIAILVCALKLIYQFPKLRKKVSFLFKNVETLSTYFDVQLNNILTVLTSLTKYEIIIKILNINIYLNIIITWSTNH